VTKQEPAVYREFPHQRKSSGLTGAAGDAETAGFHARAHVRARARVRASQG